MEKKTILIILIAIFLLIFISFMGYTYIAKEKVTVGSVNFTLPSGFKEGIIDGEFDANITNGTHAIYINEYNDNNISKFIDEYKNEHNAKNESVLIFNLTIDGKTIYKSSNNVTNANHYWFIENNKTYSIYNWGYTPNMDNIVFDLIKSMS